MGKVVYREFLGNRLVMVILALSGIGLPLAALYVIENTVTVEESVESASEFLDRNREQLRWPRRRA